MRLHNDGAFAAADGFCLRVVYFLSLAGYSFRRHPIREPNVPCHSTRSSASPLTLASFLAPFFTERELRFVILHEKTDQ